jgi:Protein kinase domain
MEFRLLYNVRTPATLGQRWQELCTRYLPIVQPDSIWRYSRKPASEDAKQGWKLHISATLLTANEILQRVGSFLEEQGVQFKGAVSLSEIGKLNSGLHYGYSQVGKCLTVYPRNDTEAVEVAEKLDELTSGIAAPRIPFDLRLKSESCVHYRYGAFNHQQIQHEDGRVTLALETPEHKQIPDVRTSPIAPDWAVDPFVTRQRGKIDRAIENPLATRFRVFRALSQRGKGGVYGAVDLESSPPRFCLIKEGRKNGEPGWDGHDGYNRTRNESKVLPVLRGLGLQVPLVYGSFEVQGCFYLVIEFIEGACLQMVLGKRKRRLPVLQVLKYGVQIADILHTLHSAGWVWGDCKPSNLAVTQGGVLRPFDFEGACLETEENSSSWVTPAFTAPECNEAAYRTSSAEDLYAMGVTLYYLLAGQYPSFPEQVPVEALRSKLPVKICDVVAALLSKDPACRPNAGATAEELRGALTIAGRGITE